MALAMYVAQRLPADASNVISTIGEISRDVKGLK